MAELIEMSFWLRTRVDPRNHVLDWNPDPHGKGQFLGESQWLKYKFGGQEL